MTSLMIYSVAVASNIDKILSYTGDNLGMEHRHLAPGALVKVPLGRQQSTGLILSSSKNRSAELNDVKLRSVLSVLPQELWLTKELVELLIWAARYYHQPLGKVLTAALPSAILKSGVGSFQPATAWEAILEDGEEVIKRLARSPRQSELFAWLQSHPQSLRSSIRDAGFDLNLLRQLQAKNLAQETQLVPTDASQEQPPTTIEEPKNPNEEQAKALDEICTDNLNKPYLLDGVTGSGKTEVYLQASEHLLLDGKQILVLVPEIGLVHQTASAFKQRFNADIFIYTSECNDSEKVRAWRAAASKKPAVFIGTRSAIFLPLANPGLVVVDEEHDLSYKQQEGFRYHARDLATLRSRELQAPLVLGSATPSLESYNNAVSGAYRHLIMRKRVSDVALPKISLQRPAAGQHLSEQSLTRIGEELKQGSQVLVFINRRGFAPRTVCENCGWIALCTECDTTLCRHVQPPLLICHHCDYRTAIPASCPNCGSAKLNHQGVGTEQLELSLQRHFPDIDCIRIDRDSTTRKGSFKHHMERANSGKPCILVGTQMLAKGHHLPALTLAVVCEADQALFSHDYRAAEHLGQLITQVAGRTGRLKKRGELIVETSYPDHPLWAKLAKNSYSEFAMELAVERQKLQLPPQSYAAMLRAESKDLSLLLNFMEIAKQTSSPKPGKVEVVGPTPSVIERKRGRYRYQLYFNSSSRKHLHQTLSTVSAHLSNLKRMSQVRWVIDVDPQTAD